jgi:2-polyprenyl-3-methyl-5-hydroxy-6-metoxy-1,4-benzoquinol methylase
MTALDEAVEIDGAKLEQFVFSVVGEIGATLNTAQVVMGERLGLYRALWGAGWLSPAELARRAGVHERYVREWLNAQAAGNYIQYEPADGTYRLAPEQAAVLADTDSPAYLAGFFQIALGTLLDTHKVVDTARTGTGYGWHEHGEDVFDGCEIFFRTGYRANLVASWLPALDGVVDKLEAGARVADIGCGHGASTILMAQAYPKSTFIGTDYHEGSIAKARARAAEAGVADRVRFETSLAANSPGEQFDFVTTFDCLHDMGDPVSAARHIHDILAPDGTWMIVEPMAGDRVEDNLNPVGRVYYGFSTFLCTPASLSQQPALALGAQAGEQRIGEVVSSGGFTRFRRAAETPFNMILEARP